MKKMALHWKILIGMFLGVLWALFSGSVGLNKFQTGVHSFYAGDA